MIKNLMDKLKEFKLPNGIIAIYLYGSFIKGRLREDSDIDIAVLTEHSMKSEERLILMSEIEALFSRIFSALGFSQNVNIIEMRSRYASIELLYDIVREGLCIYEGKRDMEKWYLRKLEMKN